MFYLWIHLKRLKLTTQLNSVQSCSKFELQTGHRKWSFCSKSRSKLLSLKLYPSGNKVATWWQMNAERYWWSCYLPIIPVPANIHDIFFVSAWSFSQFGLGIRLAIGKLTILPIVCLTDAHEWSTLIYKILGQKLGSTFKVPSMSTSMIYEESLEMLSCLPRGSHLMLLIRSSDWANLEDV